MTMITGWASLLTGAHAQKRWVAFLQIPGFSFKILNLLKFIFFLLNFPPWTANNLSHHPCAYNFDFLVFSAALHTSEFSFSQLPSFLDSLSQGYGWTVSELCLWLQSPESLRMVGFRLHHVTLHVGVSGHFKDQPMKSSGDFLGQV